MPEMGFSCRQCRKSGLGSSGGICHKYLPMNSLRMHSLGHGMCSLGPMDYPGHRSVFSGAAVLFVVAFASTKCVFADPTVESFPGSQPAHPGQPYEIRCETTWGGAPDAYVILPAEADVVDWAEITMGPTRGFTRDGKSVVSQSVFITPMAAGDYDIPEIRIGYLRPEDLAPPEAADSEKENGNAPEEFPRLRVGGLALEVRADLTVLWVSLGIVAVIVAVILVVMLKLVVQANRRNRPAPDTTESRVDFTEALRVGHLALHEAKKRRLDGDVYAFYQELTRAVSGLGADARELAGQLRRQADDVGFKDLRPVEDELDSDYRAVSRLMKQIGERDGSETAGSSQEDQES